MNHVLALGLALRADHETMRPIQLAAGIRLLHSQHYEGCLQLFGIDLAGVVLVQELEGVLGHSINVKNR